VTFVEPLDIAGSFTEDELNATGFVSLAVFFSIFGEGATTALVCALGCRAPCCALDGEVAPTNINEMKQAKPKKMAKCLRVSSFLVALLACLARLRGAISPQVSSPRLAKNNSTNTADISFPSDYFQYTTGCQTEMMSVYCNQMNDLEKLQKQIVEFRDERNWKQFHNPKDMALSLLLEAAELLEHFQWKNGQEIADHLESNKTDISEELSDVFYWVLLIAHDLDIDLPKALDKKMSKNVAKYPVDKAKGNHKKYTEL
jgi:dCTP diphosphatase